MIKRIKSSIGHHNKLIFTWKKLQLLMKNNERLKWFWFEWKTA